MMSLNIRHKHGLSLILEAIVHQVATLVNNSQLPSIDLLEQLCIGVIFCLTDWFWHDLWFVYKV